MENGKEIKVSVLVPVYNVEQWLPRCLDSILGQTLRDIEVVCVDDASPDNSAAILADYAARDPRLRIITKTANEGPMMARKTGYVNARGEYLFFCDSDDYLPSDALEALYRGASESHCDMIVGDMSFVNSKGKQIKRERTSRIGTSAESYLKAILHWTTPSLCGIIFRRSLFDNTNLDAVKNLTQSEDRMLLTQMLINCNPTISTVNKTVYYYWINDTSTTRRQITPKMASDQFTALFKCYDFVEHAPFELHADNNNFIIRYLSLYIEKGVDPRLLRDFNETSRELLRFGNMRRYVGLRMALHTYGCMNIPLYRPTLHSIRNFIRKLQGKD